MKLEPLHIIGGLMAFALLTPRRGNATTNLNSSGMSYLGRNDLPRGMRNNNPGNMRISSSRWQGKIPVVQNTDGAFEQFVNYSYGIRAMTKLLINYIQSGRNTISSILYRYAPPSDNNDTATYVRAVAIATGIGPETPLTVDRSILQSLVIALARHENGRDAITPSQFSNAWNLL